MEDQFNPDAYLAQKGVQKAASVPPVDQTQLNQFDPDQYLNDKGAVVQEQAQNKYGSIPQEFLTGVEGLASGLVSKPVVAGAEKALTAAGVPNLSPEDQEGREQANPWTHGASEVGGLGVGMLTGTGEAKLLSVAGEHAGQLAELAGLGGKEAGLLSKATAGAIKGAAENVVFQGLDETGKYINDPNSVQTAIPDIGLSALIGAGVGGTLGAASSLWKAVSAAKLGQGIEDFKSRMQEHINTPNPIQALNDEITNYYKTIKDGAATVYGGQGIKAQAIAKYMPEMSGAIGNQVNDINDALEKSIKDLGDDPHANRLKRAVEKYQNVITQDGVGPSEIFDATQDLKQQLQEWSKFNKLAPPPIADQEFIKTAKNLSFTLRNALEDSDVWGKAADVQKKLNAAFSDYKPALTDFEKKFTTLVQNEREIDPGKINTYYNQLGKPSAEIKQGMLRDFIDASNKYKAAIDSVHADLGLDSPFQPAPLNYTSQTLKEITPGARLADTIVKKGLAKLSGEAMGAGAGAGLGALAGHAWLGALVGEHALGPLIGSVLPGITKPILERMASSEGIKNAVELGASTYRGDSLLKKAAQSIFQPTSPVLGELYAKKEDVQKLDQQVKERGLSPEQIASVGNRLGEVLPDHDVALKGTVGGAVQYLNSIRPGTTKTSPLDDEIEPSPMQKLEHEKALAIAQQPLSVLALAKEGKLTPQDMAHFRQLYPALYKRTQQALSEELLNHIATGNKVPFQTKQMLSHLMGQPMDSSLTYQSTMANQAAMSANRQQAPGMTTNQPKPSVVGMRNMKAASRLSLGPKDDDS